MPEPPFIADMHVALRERLFPSITMWNRLEGRPRSVEFGDALRAEVRDALWMLTRQWQVGEFRGDDAGSPVLADYELSETRLGTFRARGLTSVSFDQSRPLEATVERRRVPLDGSGPFGSLDLRLMLGRRWLKLVPPVYRQAFVDRWGFTPPDPRAASDAELVSHVASHATLRAVAGRAVDGFRLYGHLTGGPGRHAWDGMVVADGDKDEIDDAAESFVTWASTLFEQPAAESAWEPSRLEHRFEVGLPVAGGTRTLTAEEYPGGRLDWYGLSVAAETAGGAGPTTRECTVIPQGARFGGMPHPRWWAFEDGRTNFGDIRADTTDLARLLLVEFGLVYGNDWFILPCDLEVGSVARVERLVVTNVFGERVLVDAAGAGADDDWTRWSMYTLDVAGEDDAAADTSLLLLPTVPQTGQGPPLEDVMFVRDEVANLVWGIERIVPAATGVGERGAELAAAALEHRQRLLPEPTPAPPGGEEAAVAYRVMSPMPEHWIPFPAVHVPGQSRQTQLQRGAMPRILEHDPAPPERVRPRTSVLREGFDAVPQHAYFVHEEEVPRAGTNVVVRFQRTRWRDGRVVVWLGAERRTGRGEATSGLAFDQVVPAE